jgi:transcriptional regulator with XRE-family HTH domain
VIATIKALMEWRRMTQAELAEQLNRSQPWVSKRLTGTTPFQIEDLDLFADAFGLSPAELLQEGHGKLDRRAGGDRRSGADRRHARPFPHTRMPYQHRRVGDTHDGDGFKPDGDGQPS